MTFAGNVSRSVLAQYYSIARARDLFVDVEAPPLAGDCSRGPGPPEPGVALSEAGCRGQISSVMDTID